MSETEKAYDEGFCDGYETALEELSYLLESASPPSGYHNPYHRPETLRPGQLAALKELKQMRKDNE